MKILQDSIQFYENAWGKPLLLKKSNFFSISHTGNITLFGFSSTLIGVDVERIRVFDKKKLSLFCSEKELNNMGNEINDRYLTKLWVIKESYLKMIGCGLNIPMTRYTVSFKDSTIIIVNSKNYQLNVHFRLYQLKDYIISICIKN